MLLDDCVCLMLVGIFPSGRLYNYNAGEGVSDLLERLIPRFPPPFRENGHKLSRLLPSHSLLKSFEGGLAYAFHAFELLHQSLCSDLPDPLY